MNNLEEKLVENWSKLFNQLYDIVSYEELLAQMYLRRSIVTEGEVEANKNVEALKKAGGVFVVYESALAYAVTLSITKLFEPKKRLSFLSLLKEAEILKIDRKLKFQELQIAHKETLDKYKYARDNFFAHKNREISNVDLPSYDDAMSLVDDCIEFMNDLGSEIGRGHTYINRRDEFSLDMKTGFEKLLDVLKAH